MVEARSAAKVMDPELHVDPVNAGMVKDVRVSGVSVKLKIELTTPVCPLKGKIRADAEAELIRTGAWLREAGGAN